jgi:hypothetical protein
MQDTGCNRNHSTQLLYQFVRHFCGCAHCCYSLNWFQVR